MKKLADGERVAIVVPFLPRTHIGGVEIFSAHLRQALGSARVFAAPRQSGWRAKALVRLGLLDPFRAILGARAFLRVHNENPFDLVITNGLFGWPLRLDRPDIPMIQVYHFTLAGFAQAALRLRADALTTARIGGWFDRASGIGKEVVAVSESVRRELSRFYGLESRVIPNSVNVSRFHRLNRGDSRDRLGLPKGRELGVYVGRPEYAKGFDLLCEVATSMPDILFLAVSPSAPAPENVRFFTDVPHETMPLLYSAADFFLSSSRYEGFNLSLLEALACELPAVTGRGACAFEDDPADVAVVADPPTPAGFVEGARQALREGPRAGVRKRIVERFSSEVFDRSWRELASSVTGHAWTRGNGN